MIGLAPLLRFARAALLAAAWSAISGPAHAASVAFEPPSENERRRAIGNLFEEPETIRPLFQPSDDFAPITLPGRGDWLNYHRETGQTFDEFRESGANRPDEYRKVIYLLPLGEFPEDDAPPLELLRAYAAAFFQLEVRVIPAYHPHGLEFGPRNNESTGRRQLHSASILAWLQKRLPPDAYCLLGVTMEDLYPSPSWNFVFGQASLDERVGVYSFARYDPAFFGRERRAAWRDTALRRGCKVLAHETAHLFGLPHCIYFNCVVNGANHLDESDAQPLHACPVCLRKLRLGAGFDPVRRYEQLRAFYRGQRWYEDADWVERQLARVATRTAADEKP
ncbi:MAG: hypothetical protein C0518_09330 [Opitutus sp.]|nr:hypothetical protein [Opitutus sp.]